MSNNGNYWEWERRGNRKAVSKERKGLEDKDFNKAIKYATWAILFRTQMFQRELGTECETVFLPSAPGLTCPLSCEYLYSVVSDSSLQSAFTLPIHYGPKRKSPATPGTDPPGLGIKQVTLDSHWKTEFSIQHLSEMFQGNFKDAHLSSVVIFIENFA